MSRAWKGCLFNESLNKTKPTVCDNWKFKHIRKSYCKGTAQNMKPDGEKRIWERSVVKSKRRYIKLYDDGDNKRFITSNALTQVLK